MGCKRLMKRPPGVHVLLKLTKSYGLMILARTLRCITAVSWQSRADQQVPGPRGTTYHPKSKLWLQRLLHALSRLSQLFDERPFADCTRM